MSLKTYIQLIHLRDSLRNWAKSLSSYAMSKDRLARAGCEDLVAIVKEQIGKLTPDERLEAESILIRVSALVLLSEEILAVIDENQVAVGQFKIRPFAREIGTAESDLSAALVRMAARLFAEYSPKENPSSEAVNLFITASQLRESIEHGLIVLGDYSLDQEKAIKDQVELSVTMIRDNLLKLTRAQEEALMEQEQIAQLAKLASERLEYISTTKHLIENPGNSKGDSSKVLPFDEDSLESIRRIVLAFEQRIC